MFEISSNENVLVIHLSPITRQKNELVEFHSNNFFNAKEKAPKNTSVAQDHFSAGVNIVYTQDHSPLLLINTFVDHS
jgi:hypothetical protein